MTAAAETVGVVETVAAAVAEEMPAAEVQAQAEAEAMAKTKAAAEANSAAASAQAEVKAAAEAQAQAQAQAEQAAATAQAQAEQAAATAQAEQSEQAEQQAALERSTCARLLRGWGLAGAHASAVPPTLLFQHEVGPRTLAAFAAVNYLAVGRVGSERQKASSVSDAVRRFCAESCAGTSAGWAAAAGTADWWCRWRCQWQQASVEK